LISRIQEVAVTPDRLPALLTHEEYTGMMRDLDTAGHWMRGQLALKRASPSTTPLKQSTAGASQMAADACQPIDDNHSSTQPHARREA